MKIKLLTIIEELNMGGIEKTFLGCVDILKENNFECYIYTKTGGILENAFREKGVKILPAPDSKNPIKNTLILLRYLKRHEIDIVHSRNGFTSGFYSLASFLLGTPMIISIHNSQSNFRKKWKEKILLRKIRIYYLSLHKYLIHQFAHSILGHSKNNLKYYSSYITRSPEKYKVVYNGIKLNNYYREISPFKISSEIRLVHIGSFREQKNHITLLKITSQLIESGMNVHLTLCGDGALRQTMERKANEMGILENISFLGVVETTSDILKNSHIFIFPSINEGFGNVLIEAQSAGVAICASDIPPHYEAVSPNYHRYFFPAKDAELGALRLKELCENFKKENFLDELKTAQNFAAQFTIEQMSEDLIEVYEGALVNIKK